jgi:hypothetical protein
VVIRKTRIEKYVYKAINPFGQRQMFFKYIRRSRKWNKNSKRYVILNQDLDGSERPDHHVFLFFREAGLCIFGAKRTRQRFPSFTHVSSSFSSSFRNPK